MKKKSHPEFVRALKARNLKITVVGTYENCLSRVRCITTGEVFDTLREAAAKYGVSRSAISQCCSEPPKLKRAGGREWEYVDLLSGER